MSPAGAGGGPHPPQQRAQQHEGVVEGEGSEGAAWCAEAGGLGGRGRGGGRARSGCGACRSHGVKESRRLAALVVAPTRRGPPAGPRQPQPKRGRPARARVRHLAVPQSSEARRVDAPRADAVRGEGGEVEGGELAESVLVDLRAAGRRDGGEGPRGGGRGRRRRRRRRASVLQREAWARTARAAAAFASSSSRPRGATSRLSAQRIGGSSKEERSSRSLVRNRAAAFGSVAARL